jgi:hypothetical protein
MMPQLTEAIAIEQARDRQRSLDLHRHHAAGELPGRRPHRVAVRCGYWLISIGCRLVAPDLSAMAH